ncbi:hypothetical protein J2T56_001346 [Natronobacillus azotifigens]|uniref:Sporulation histidine kinase inhibitor Sda n=1 Tax=Natronobacillus azotifigens TaxID=472978 RepID=A0A9J6RCK1_9BACI|nr:sporulation histidine kinase inhibitor Sda [Natronobacillus azotifigens]MCZ0703086.1 sporulation histidine kinase inhibitor Sda [Natronobacillus azotifigens]
MHMLSDQLLFEVYEKAVELSLDRNFIQLIKQEIKNREAIKKVH